MGRGPEARDEVVSCRVAMMIVQHAHLSGWEEQDWLEGVPYSSAHLEHPFGWITYEAMAALCANAARLAGSVSALRRMGAETEWERLGPFHRAIVALGRPSLAYALAPAWMVLFNRASATRVEMLGEDSCLLWGSYELTHELQYLADELVAGGIASIPRLYGLPPAEVEILAARPGSSRQVAFRIRWSGESNRGVRLAAAIRLATRPSVTSAIRSALADIDAMIGQMLAGETNARALPPPVSLRSADPSERAALLRSELDTAPLVAAGLTEREIDVTQHTCAGMATKEIAEALGISVPAVKVHLAEISRKLQVDGRTALVARVLGGGDRIAAR